MTVRLGIVGAGVMGMIHAENITRRVPGADLVAVADRIYDRAENCKSLFQAGACYTGASEMFAATELDGVVICTPPETHADIITEAAQRGLHIFVEKPLERDLVAADHALSVVQRAGVKLQVGFQRRFDNATRAAFESLRAGAIGDPLTLHIVARDPVREAGAKPPGDLFIDTTVHDLDIAAWMLDSEPEVIFATGGVKDGLDDPDYAVTVLTFANNTVATIDNNRLARYGFEQRMEISGSKGVLTVGEPGTSPDSGADDQPFFVRRYDAAYVAELRDFVRCIAEDSQPLVTGPEGRRALALALAAWQAYREQRPVFLPDEP